LYQLHPRKVKNCYYAYNVIIYQCYCCLSLSDNMILYNGYRLYSLLVSQSIYLLILDYSRVQIAGGVGGVEPLPAEVTTHPSIREKTCRGGGSFLIPPGKFFVGGRWHDPPQEQCLSVKIDGKTHYMHNLLKKYNFQHFQKLKFWQHCKYVFKFFRNFQSHCQTLTPPQLTCWGSWPPQVISLAKNRSSGFQLDYNEIYKSNFCH